MADTVPDWASAAPAVPDWAQITPPSAPQPTLGDKLMQTWPMRMARDVIGAVSAPGDVATGAANVAPSVTGQWSDEDEARLQATNAGLVDRARTLATLGPSSVAARAGEGIFGVPTTRPQVVPPAPSIAELKSAAVAGYQAPEVQAVKMSADAGPQLADEIIAHFNDPEIGIDENVAPKTFGILNKLYNVPDDSFLTVNNLRTLRRTLGNAAASPDATERLAAKSAQQHLDEFLSNMPAQHVIEGDPGAAAAILKDANANYAAMSRAADLDTRLVRAQLRASAANSGMNVGNTIRQRMADILVNPKLRRGFTSDELDQMKGIVEGSTAANVMRMGSNILGGGGGMLSALWSMAGHGIAPLAGWALRRASNMQTMRAAKAFNEAVRQRSPLAQERAANAPVVEPGLLPSRSAPLLGANSIGEAIQLPATVKAQSDQDRAPGIPNQQKDGGAIHRQPRAWGGKVHSAKDNAKATKAQAHYRGGNSKERCSICSMYRAPNSCTAVRGQISPRGLCDYFEKKVERARGGHVPRRAKDGHLYIPDHNRPGKFLMVVPRG